MASTTITISTNINMRKFYKDTRKAYKDELFSLRKKIQMLPFWRFLYIWILNNKADKLEAKIFELNKLIKTLK